MGYNKYSIIGFSEGARIALLMATKYPKIIDSLVLSAIKTSTTTKELKAFFASKSVDKWSEKKLKAYLNVYESKDEIQKLWNRFHKFAEFLTQYFPEGLYKDKYHLVRCPVLITHGDRVCNQINHSEMHKMN